MNIKHSVLMGTIICLTAAPIGMITDDPDSGVPPTKSQDRHPQVPQPNKPEPVQPPEKQQPTPPPVSHDLKPLPFPEPSPLLY